MMRPMIKRDWFAEGLMNVMVDFIFHQSVRVNGSESSYDELYELFMSEVDKYLPQALCEIMDDTDAIKAIWEEATKAPLVRTWKNDAPECYALGA